MRYSKSITHLAGVGLVIAGLIQESTRQNLDSVPGIKDVPVLQV